jgi:catechol 2,3-dioxygenase-like lactoylglutathione lyase family enzyme
MSATQASGDVAANGAPDTVPMRFEVTTLPVADVDRAKAFYQALGWRLDIDFKPTEHSRTVQFTPPGSPASIQFGQGTTSMTPGSLQGMFLVVDDIDVARADLISRGAEHRSYNSFVSFADPDGNRWLVQEITERLPGRV